VTADRLGRPALRCATNPEPASPAPEPAAPHPRPRASGTGRAGTPPAPAGVGDRVGALRVWIVAHLAGRTDGYLPLVLVALAAIAIGHAMARHKVSDFGGARPWLVVAVVLVVLALLLPRVLERRLPGRVTETLLLVAMGAAMTLGAWQILTVPDLLPLPGPAGRPLEGADARTLVVVAWLLAVTGLRREAPLGRLHTPVFLGVMLVLGAWLINVMWSPPIDVWVFQRDAALRLADGLNPYAMDFPNIYGHDDYYGEGVVVDGRVTYGYPYMPVTLLFYLPAELLVHDPRAGNLVALIAAAALIAWSRPGRIGRGAAGMLLLTPTVLHLLRYSWTEPIVLLLLAATVTAAVRAPRATGIFLGLFLTAKQFCLVAVPVALLLLRPGGTRREAGRLVVSTIVGAAIGVVPFLLWDVPAFTKAIVEIAAHTAMRFDSLGFGPEIANMAGGDVPGWVPFAAAGIAVLLALLRAPWTPSGFAIATGLAILAFFIVARQAFPNYYFLVVGAIAIGIAAAAPAARATPPPVGAGPPADGTTR